MAEWTEREHPEWLDTRTWEEWRALCALGLCTKPVREALTDFAGFHWRRMVRRYAYRTNAPEGAVALTAGESWHLFETHLTARQSREGKRYKDWLFARVSPETPDPMRAVAGGAVLLMRDAAREYLSREFAPAATVSLADPLAPGEAGHMTVEDLLPDRGTPADEAILHEYESMARERAEEWFAAMGSRERVILLARSMGIPLAHPLVAQTAGCRKSKACLLMRGLVEGLAADVRRDYPGDAGEDLRRLALLTLEALNERVRSWASGESRCAELLTLANTYEEAAIH